MCLSKNKKLFMSSFWRMANQSIFLGVITVENGTADGILEGVDKFFSQIGMPN